MRNNAGEGVLKGIPKLLGPEAVKRRMAPNPLQALLGGQTPAGGEDSGTEGPVENLGLLGGSGGVAHNLNQSMAAKAPNGEGGSGGPLDPRIIAYLQSNPGLLRELTNLAIPQTTDQTYGGGNGTL